MMARPPLLAEEGNIYRISQHCQFIHTLIDRPYSAFLRLYSRLQDEKQKRSRCDSVLIANIKPLRIQILGEVGVDQ